MTHQDPKLEVYLCRHGETEWTKSGQHTGLSDIPLTEIGEKQAILLGNRLFGIDFTKVFCSPLARAKRTCELSGYLSEADIWDALYEWNYGDYEGLTTPDIRKVVPGWTIFNDGAVNGETISAVQSRADRVIEKVKTFGGKVALFSSGHFSRVLAARWLGFDAGKGRHFALSTGSLCILGYEREVPVLKLWNDTDFLLEIDGK